MTECPRAAGRAWLFVPGDRADRFETAAASGADQVILDLEDAVAEDHKDAARAAVVAHVSAGARCWVRINAVGTPWHADDLAAFEEAAPAGLMVPKAESVDALRVIGERLRPGVGLVPLVESAVGLESAGALAAYSRTDRLAFGSIDFALDIGAEHTAEALLHARSHLVVASRAAGTGSPIDGVTTALDPGTSRVDAVRARSLGMGGKLCIHPRQVEAVRAAFRSSEAEVEQARRVVAAAEATPYGAVAVDGRMIDKPVLERARQLLAEVDAR